MTFADILVNYVIPILCGVVVVAAAINKYKNTATTKSIKGLVTDLLNDESVGDLFDDALFTHTGQHFWYSWGVHWMGEENSIWKDYYLFKRKI